MLKFFTLALLATSLITTVAYADTVKITFLGVGDIYSFEGGKIRGGIARLNAVARAEKAANPNTIYVMDGDMLSPSLLSGFDKGENMIVLSNVVPYDLAVPGNHEYDAGQRISQTRSSFPNSLGLRSISQHQMVTRLKVWAA